MSEERTIEELERRLQGAPLILFDGVCNLCQWSVQFVIRHDRQQTFYFSSLQSEWGQLLLREHGLGETELKTMVHYHQGQVDIRSAAALKIARRLSGLWSLTALFIFVPARLRDGIYQWVSRNRYAWFGRKEECWIPSDSLAKRFLETRSQESKPLNNAEMKTEIPF